jgi:hypothetical protein
MSGGNQVAVINALKFLGLISSEGIPTANFYNLADAEGKERAKIWREILVNAYSFLLNDLDIERATSRLVVEKFRDADMSGDTIRKAIQFFLSAAKDVEMKVSPHVKATHTQSGARTRTPRARRTDGRTGDESPDDDGEDNNPPDPPPTAKSPYQVLIEILSPQMEEPEQDAVWTLIRYLKKQEAKGE